MNISNLDISVNISDQFRQCCELLRELLLSERFTDGFIGLLQRRLLDGCEIKDMNLSAVGAGMSFGVFASENDFEALSALVAANRLCDGEVPFHDSKAGDLDAEANVSDQATASARRG